MADIHSDLGSSDLMESNAAQLPRHLRNLSTDARSLKSTGVPWCVASLLCAWPGEQT